MEGGEAVGPPPAFMAQFSLFQMRRESHNDLAYILIISLGQEEGETHRRSTLRSPPALSLDLQRGVLSDAIGSWKGSFI